MVNPSIFPTRLVSPIFAMELEMEKKISGTRRTNSMFSQICPIGYKNTAFSLSTSPMIAPKMTNAIRMIGSR